MAGQGSITEAEQNRRDVLVAKNLAEGMAAPQAIIAAGYSSTTAYQRSEQIIARISKTSPMIDALNEVNVTTAHLAKTIKKGLKARRPTITKTKGGETTVIEGGADHATRHKFLETAVRLRGEDPDKHAESTTVETFEERVRRLRGISVVKSFPPPSG